MARLAVAAAGAAIGSVIPGVGSSVGWIVGSIVGNLLFPPGTEDINQEGPRLGDLSVGGSTYGAGIPIMYGTQRLAGNLIWAWNRKTGSESAPAIEEVSTTSSEEVGGKGGGGQTVTTTTYSYYATFATAFAGVEIDDVLRMWADGKLIYDKTGTGDTVIKNGVVFRVYRGTEDQEPDAIIMEDKGEYNTPAYRGLAYIVFDRLPLADFGNRRPMITAELTTNQTSANTYIDADFYTVAEGGLTDTITTSSLAPDYDRGLFYAYASSGTVGQNIIRVFNSNTVQEVRQKAYDYDASARAITFGALDLVMPNGYIIMASDWTSNFELYHLIDPDSLEILHTVVSTARAVSPAYTSSWVRLLGLFGLQYYYLAGQFTNKLTLFQVKDSALTYVWDTDAPGQSSPAINDGNIYGSTHGITGHGFGDAFVLSGTTTEFHIFRIRVSANASYFTLEDSYQGVDVDVVATITVSTDLPSQVDTIRGLVYDPIDNTVMFQVDYLSANAYMVKVDPEDGSIVWISSVPDIRNSQSGLNSANVSTGVYGQIDTTRAWALYTNSGDVFYDDSGWTRSQATSGASFWNGPASSVIGISTIATISKWIFLRGGGNPVTLDSIVSDLCLRTSLESSDIDVTDLASESVYGYAIARQTNIRDVIQTLMPIYLFDGVESDYKLKWFLRDGKSSIATIPQEDLILKDNGDFFLENRIQEVDLPSEVSITFMDKDRDYLQGSVSAKRMLGPVNSMNSKNKLGFTLAISMSADDAKQAAEKILYSSWIERSNYSISTSWEYIGLDPSDVVTIELDDGTIFRTRLTQADLGRDLSIEMSALSEEAAQYTSTIEADGGVVPDQQFPTQPITKLVLLPTPLLRDSDDTGRSTSVLYFTMGGYGQGQWDAGTLLKSAENTDYSTVGSIINEMSWGTAVNALGDTSTPFQTDETNTLTVYMVTGASNLSSVTQLEMLNGANAAALVHSNGTDVEIIQFRDVTVNSDNSRTLSGLLRGRRGTEVFTSGHLAGNTFILLSALTASKTLLSLGEKDQTRYYRAVSMGQLLESSLVQTLASPLNDLKPYAVVNHEATIDGSNNITIAWVRRTRVGGDLQDGTGTVPVSEDSEEYEIEIFDGPAGSEVREVTGLSSPSYTYSATDQATDGFSPPLSQITVKVYQISAQVGRGFSVETTINVV